jgi:hypothetical protein
MEDLFGWHGAHTVTARYQGLDALQTAVGSWATAQASEPPDFAERQYHLVERLLTMGADIHSCHGHVPEDTGYGLAIRVAPLQIPHLMPLLARHGLNLDWPSSNGWTALMHVVSDTPWQLDEPDMERAVQTLLALGARIDVGPHPLNALKVAQRRKSTLALLERCLLEQNLQPSGLTHKPARL